MSERNWKKYGVGDSEEFSVKEVDLGGLINNAETALLILTKPEREALISGEEYIESEMKVRMRIDPRPIPVLIREVRQEAKVLFSGYENAFNVFSAKQVYLAENKNNVLQ